MALVYGKGNRIRFSPAKGEAAANYKAQTPSFFAQALRARVRPFAVM